MPLADFVRVNGMLSSTVKLNVDRHGQPSAAGASLETAKVALRAVEGDFSPKSHEFLIKTHRKHQLKAQGLTLNRFKRSGGPIYLGLDGFPLKTLAGFWK